MSDLYQYPGDDLHVSNTGDLLTTDGTTEGQQRVLRRLVTNPGDYIWHAGYGGGLPQQIGNIGDARTVTANVRAQMFLEAIVSHSPDPAITVQSITGGMAVQIQYVDAVSNKPVSLSFNINQ